MSKTATKAADNAFYLARMAAAKFNDRFASREGASEELGIDRTRLARIELETITPYPEEAVLMADAYRAPELCNFYCAHQCPLGRLTVNAIELEAFQGVTLKLLSMVNKLPEIKDSLIDIAADGTIDDDERYEFDKIIQILSTTKNEIESLLLVCRKEFDIRAK